MHAEREKSLAPSEACEQMLGHWAVASRSSSDGLFESLQAFEQH